MGICLRQGLSDGQSPLSPLFRRASGTTNKTPSPTAFIELKPNISPSGVYVPKDHWLSLQQHGDFDPVIKRSLPAGRQGPCAAALVLKPNRSIVDIPAILN